MNNTLLKRIDTSHQQIIIKEIPNVNVLMSTYNGSKFLSKQIESIAAQCGVSISLTIRDDGSNDRTPYLAKKYLADIEIKILHTIFLAEPILVFWVVLRNYCLMQRVVNIMRSQIKMIYGNLVNSPRL